MQWRLNPGGWLVRPEEEYQDFQIMPVLKEL